MELADWIDRWAQGQTAFHQEAINGVLDSFSDEVFGPGVDRTLVPLCGKTRDMVFLADRSAEVLGVEIAEQAVQEFFAERSITAAVETGPPLRYVGGNYQLFVADFFNLGSGDIGEIDAVFDRAALVALDADTRVRYANHLASLLGAGAKVLLVTFDYVQREMNGPPFAVSDREVAELFEGNFVIQHLQTRDVLNDRFREAGLTSMTESAFALTRT